MKTFLFHLFFRFSIRSFFNDDFWKSAQREFHAPNDSSWRNNFGQNHFVFLFMASGTGISKDRKNPFYILKLQQFFALTEITQKNRKSLKKEKSPIQICFLIPCSESFAFTRILISFLRHQGYQHWVSYHKACENFNGKHSTWQLSEKYRQGGLINGRVTRAWKTWFKWYLGEWTWWEWNGNILKNLIYLQTQSGCKTRSGLWRNSQLFYSVSSFRSNLSNNENLPEQLVDTKFVKAQRLQWKSVANLVLQGH